AADMDFGDIDLSKPNMGGGDGFYAEDDIDTEEEEAIDSKADVQWRSSSVVYISYSGY
ncbi:hypothetical protein Tco_1513757, partial [Tanacetum coccineum]